MELDADFFKEVLIDFSSRCEQHRLVGISYKDFVEGRTVPEGWQLDHCTLYFLPPNYIDTDGMHS